jgi:archaellum component FlaC
MRELYLEDRLVRIEAEIAGLSEIARARTMASVDMRPRIDRLEGQMRDVVKMVHHLAEMLTETSARAAAPSGPPFEELRDEIEDLRGCVGALVQLVAQLAAARAAA